MPGKVEARRKLLEIWEKLDPAKKERVAARVAEYFAKKFKDKPEEAIIEFIQFMVSDEGALVWPWMWKSDCREEAIELAVSAMKLVSRLLSSIG